MKSGGTLKVSSVGFTPRDLTDCPAPILGPLLITILLVKSITPQSTGLTQDLLSIFDYPGRSLFTIGKMGSLIPRLSTVSSQLWWTASGPPKGPEPSELRSPSYRLDDLTATLEKNRSRNRHLHRKIMLG